jgi:acyl-CoA reductase-like NAD-dependent aldehyde dehydrogenase
MTDFSLTIDGQSVPGEGSFGVVNPATGQVFAQAPSCSRAQLDAAMEAAHRSLAGWQRILTQEQGKPLAKGVGEILGASVWFDYTASLELPVEVVQDDENVRVEVHRRPLGVVGAITPWNFPVLLAVWKIAPALLAGNTIVMKPSPFTPIATLALGEIAARRAAARRPQRGVGQRRARRLDHPAPGVRKISFTGSVATGKRWRRRPRRT